LTNYLIKLNMTILTEKTELQRLMQTYFEMYSAEESRSELNSLLQAWINSDTEMANSNIEIANKVFFVSNLTSLITKVADLDFHTQLVIDERSETLLFFCELFDEFGPEYPKELLMQALQSWIYSDDYSGRPLARIADAVTVFSLIGKLVSKLEALLM
jgi:hypothetical protein